MQITAQDFRTIVGRSLGWSLIKSTAFTVKRTGNGFRFEGQGFGHGVGLCVLGSVGRAEHGDSPKAILAEYFPGLKIRPMTSVTLPPVTAPTTPAPTLASGEATDAHLPDPPSRLVPTQRPHRPPLRWASPHLTAPAAPDRPAAPAHPPDLASPSSCPPTPSLSAAPSPR